MILYMSYEEVRSLRQGARSFLREEPQGGSLVVASPPIRAEVGAFKERLVGDIGVGTLAQQRTVASAVETIVKCLRAEMEALIADTHPAHEGAVAAYFDYAHALSVLQRLREMGGEMEAMIELVTGSPSDSQTAASFQFPD